ncbi:hypothetical protein BDE02_08G138100 [Populus trichocarpa]|jgi:hypothetical protein|nr:hypothetical protein BDE02_08G138100 [Populus trichocarpa]
MVSRPHTYVHIGVRFRYIFVGNNAIPGVVQSVVQPAIGNLYNSVRKTAVGDKVRGSSSPPSAGQFANGADKIMNNLTVICTV